MKKIFALFLTVAIYTVNFAQSQFRADFYYAAKHDDNSNEWVNKKAVSISFVFNHDESDDVIMYKNSGAQVKFKSVSELQPFKNREGEEFTIGKFLDENGDTFYLAIAQDYSKAIFMYPSWTFGFFVKL